MILCLTIPFEFYTVSSVASTDAINSNYFENIRLHKNIDYKTGSFISETFYKEKKLYALIK